tara:strand:+ start:20313 stop:21152 length:840 start_codon:yes stop_codon:yes gene_type:complete
MAKGPNSKFKTIDINGLSVGRPHPPRIMGILNLSPESPYKPSIYSDVSKAVGRIEQMIEQGADIIDIGLSSANRKIKPLDEKEEMRRLDFAIQIINEVQNGAIFSVETRYARVAEEALENGWDMVNDICGFADPEMPKVCEKYDAAVVKMAGSGRLDQPGALDRIDDIYADLQQGLTDKTIIDPAFGGWSENKTLETDNETFRRLKEFCELGPPVLISINRKNFIKEIVGKTTEKALPGSLAATAIAVGMGVRVVRTHDISETRDAAMVGHIFSSGELK